MIVSRIRFHKTITSTYAWSTVHIVKTLLHGQKLYWWVFIYLSNLLQ